MSIVHDAGFTTVEVLITLFVGVMLLGGGYQLYSIVTQSNAATRNQTDASNIAYEQLRKHSAQIGGACEIESLDISDDIPADTTLSGDLEMTMRRDCPFGVGDGISLMTVKLVYGEEGSTHEVSHGLYAK